MLTQPNLQWGHTQSWKKPSRNSDTAPFSQERVLLAENHRCGWKEGPQKHRRQSRSQAQGLLSTHGAQTAGQTPEGNTVEVSELPSLASRDHRVTGWRAHALSVHRHVRPATQPRALHLRLQVVSDDVVPGARAATGTHGSKRSKMHSSRNVHSAGERELPEDTREHRELGESVFLTLLVILFHMQIGNPLWREMKAANSTKYFNVLIHVKILEYFMF